MYLVTSREMQEMDRLTIESVGIPGRVLMENAGRGATQVFIEHFSDAAPKKVGVIAGKGNNGGDGFVMARYLSEMGIRITVFLLGNRERVKPGDAAENLALLDSYNVDVIEIPDEPAFSKHLSLIRHQDIWIDAIFGTGLSSDVRGYYQYVIESINRLNRPVFAVDIPSGLDSDTGQPCGVCIQASVTATFAYPKIGHLVYPGAKYTGKLFVIDIGIPKQIANQINPKQSLLTPQSIVFDERPPDAHKGHAGHALVIAGSPGKTGAAAMTAMSAMRVGAGLVTLGIAESLNSVLETQVLEVMTCPLPETSEGILGMNALKPIQEQMHGKKCLAIGPGIGTDGDTRQLVHEILRSATLPMVIDADGLNNLAGSVEMLKLISVPVILTPHPGEMARLADRSAQEIQTDRISASRRFAQEFNVHLVLKGARTVIAHPDGTVFVNPTGNSGMASGGMGDVLTGIIAGLLAQGHSPEFSTHAGVYLHGAAADAAAERIGSVGYLASDVKDAIPCQMAKQKRREFSMPVFPIVQII